MNNYIKVKDKNHLLRDTVSNGIVSTDFESYQTYVQNYKRSHNQNKTIENLEDQINVLKNDMNELKSLLRSVLNESK